MESTEHFQEIAAKAVEDVVVLSRYFNFFVPAAVWKLKCLMEGIPEDDWEKLMSDHYQQLYGSH